MRLYGAIQKIEPLDDGTVRVHGIATSEAVDDQGEIVRADAMRAAIPDYMRFPALREMHQLSAAGTTLEAEVGEDGMTRIVAHVVDPVAVAKVKSQVYRGFSIGGRVTQRETGNPKAITSLVLNEISLVDRPANPEAVLDCWKSSMMSEAQFGEADLANSTSGLTTPAQTPPERQPFNSPFQIWACGLDHHHHLAKTEAMKCLEKRAVEPTSTQTAIDADSAASAKVESVPAENQNGGPAPRTAAVEPDKRERDVKYADPGYQSDGKNRYQIDTERHIRAAWSYINQPRNAKKYTANQLTRIKATIIAAWKEKIGAEGPPSAHVSEKAYRTTLTKALWDVGHVARVILDLDSLKDALELEAAMEADNSPQLLRLQTIITKLCEFLSALVTEETGEILSESEMDAGPPAPAPGMLAMAAGACEGGRIAALLQKGNPNMRKLAASLLVKAKHSQTDQALLDMAHLACNKCLQIDGLSAGEKEHMSKARDHLRRAGAISIVGTADGVEVTAPQTDLPAIEFRPSDNTAADTLKILPLPIDPGVLDAIAAALCKRGRAHQHLMDVAHECVCELTDGQICAETIKVGARHSTETIEHLSVAHHHLVAAGAKCDAVDASGLSRLDEKNPQDIGVESSKSPRAGDLAKALASERAEKTALIKTLGEIVPMIDRLTRRVEEIASTPLPPLTIAKGTISVSKQQDGGMTDRGDPELSPDAIASALAKLSKEEQTLTLIKASYANPIRGPGVTGGDR
jgi:hypothetical protein